MESIESALPAFKPLQLNKFHKLPNILDMFVYVMNVNCNRLWMIADLIAKKISFSNTYRIRNRACPRNLDLFFCEEIQTGTRVHAKR